MIPIRSLPVVEPDKSKGWKLVFWMGETFDYMTPFRAALAEMAEVLSRHKPSNVSLPDYEKWEDFIEGSLQFGQGAVHVYYEHSLSYLSLTSQSPDILHEILSDLQSNFKVA
jgi:hypothetical protein